MSGRMNVIVSEDPRATVVVNEEVITVVSVGVQGPPGPQGPAGDADMTIYDGHLVATTDVHGIADTAEVATLADLASVDASLPTTTTGDLIVHGEIEPVRLPVGAEGEALTVVSGVPAWAVIEGGSGGGIAGVPARPAMIAGRYYDISSDFHGMAATTGNAFANFVWCQPLLIPYDVTIDRIGFNSLVTSDSVVLGMYTTGSDGLPDELVFSTAPILVSSTGIKEVVISQMLPAGWYWTASNRATGVSAELYQYSTIKGNVVGLETPGADSIRIVAARTLTYNGTLPALFGAVTNYSTLAHRIAVRAAV